MPRRGGGWPRETVLPHSGKPTPPRFARLPLPEEGARMIFKETLIKSLSFAVWVLRFPHMCRTPLRFPHLSFIPPVPYPPLRGTFPSRGRLAIRGIPSSDMAAKPPSLPSPQNLLHPTTFPLFPLCSMLYCAKMGLEIIQCMNMRVII